MKKENLIYSVIVALIMGVLLIGTSLFGLQEVFYWQRNGVITQGIILDKYIKEDCQTSGSNSTRTCINNFYLSYRYSVFEGKFFEGVDSINQSIWSDLEKGSEITLLYSSIQPRLSSVNYALDSNIQKSLWMLVLGLGALFTLIGSVLLIKLIVRRSDD